MRSFVKWVGVVGLTLSALLFWRAESIEAAEPVVFSVLEGQDTGSGEVSLVVIGKKVSKFKLFDLRDEGGNSVAEPTQTLRSKSLIVLTVPGTTEPGAYQLAMTTSGRKAQTQTFDVAIRKGTLAPMSVGSASLGQSLRSDLDDAVTVGGIAPDGFVAVSGAQTIGGTKTFDETVTANVDDGNGLVGIASATTGTHYGVSGQSAAERGRGVWGVATATSGSAAGVEGVSYSGTGNGIVGQNLATTGPAVGVYGSTNNTNGGIAVQGIVPTGEGTAFAVVGSSGTTGGGGVLGVASSTTGTAQGVAGRSSSPTGTGVHGIATATSGTGTGVAGTSLSSNGVGVLGTNSATTGSAYGVSGQSSSTVGAGVHGTGRNGVYGSSNAQGGAGVWGTNEASTGVTYGVYGLAYSTQGFGISGDSLSSTGGTYGVYGRAFSPNGTAVYGQNEASSGPAYGVRGANFATTGIAVSGHAFAMTGSTTGVSGTSQSSSGIGVIGASSGSASSATGVVARSTGGGNAFSAQQVSSSTSASSTSALNIALFQAIPTGGGAFANQARIDRDGRGYFNGGTAASGADFAESVSVEGDAAAYEPGDVMVVSLDGDRRFALSTVPQSTLVAGVYSTKPALLGSAHPDAAGTDDYTAGEIPLGVVGIVPTKVCDENGPIRRGDLLVTSSVPGHAMRAPADARPGTIVGKALGELESGTGMIEILLSLQ